MKRKIRITEPELRSVVTECLHTALMEAYHEVDGGTDDGWRSPGIMRHSWDDMNQRAECQRQAFGGKGHGEP